MRIDASANELVAALLKIAASETVCILDSCGVNHLGSHLLIGGINPVSVNEISDENCDETLRFLDSALGSPHAASIFTISYNFGRKLLNIAPKKQNRAEPDIFLAQFDALVIHDYASGETTIIGDAEKSDMVRSQLLFNIAHLKSEISDFKSEIELECENVESNFARAEYLSAIENIQERIRDGDTYQTNLTQQLSAKLPDGFTPEKIFYRLRRDHPAPFAAFIKRLDSTVVSISPERFFRVSSPRAGTPHVTDGPTRIIETSPIKGTRPRGKSSADDTALKNELVTSDKDRAENTMIVDLLRNDLGRICEYGSIRVERLCELEEHPTLFHLVSTISGDLRNDIAFSDILKAVFPCGSITGAPKISTMRIIDEIETVNRDLSMGAIGYYVPGSTFQVPSSIIDLNVAIRTMVIKEQTATFHVGGGIVIDSDPISEYEETLTKARALLDAIGTSSELRL